VTVQQGRESKESTRAVFLDRDGVINASVVRDGKPYPPDTLEELVLLPKVKEAMDALSSAGYVLIVVTNQPDVATGKQSMAVVKRMHDKLCELLPIDDIYACYCVEGPDCECYKPSPKMLIDAAEAWNVNFDKSFMVGDRWRDIEAGKAVGCSTFFVDCSYKEKQPNPDYIVRDLQEAAAIILSLQ